MLLKPNGKFANNNLTNEQTANAMKTNNFMKIANGIGTKNTTKS